ncbi:MAG: hypothetical protein DSY82_05120 [Flavobacteriia bacterium]|nr:MAG: hypothetical protein DSY82_05120 [Flavobacteriia bacterium]
MLFTLSVLFGCTSKTETTKEKNDKKIMVFFLAGQSNMDGRARAYKLVSIIRKITLTKQTINEIGLFFL